ncbi:hypothetical protein PtB15_1B704 [Puccinia triticina]|nr:hypothetical protein PtB15_1B704 [Puccinia triticina]
MDAHRASSHQELITHPGRTAHTQHAFGADSDDDDDEHGSASDDDGLGFQVYKDQASHARYADATSAPSTPGAQPHSMAPAQQPPRAAPVCRYPPEEHPPIQHSNTAYKPAPADLVHMPALGDDWTKDESRRDKHWEGKDSLANKHKWRGRKHKLLLTQAAVGAGLRAFLAGRRRLGGWFSRFMALGLLLVLLLLATLLAYFLVPRVPELAYNNAQTFEGDSGPGLSFQTLDPVRFAFAARINLAMQAKTSHVRPRTQAISVIIKDLSSAAAPVEVARGTTTQSVAIDTKDYTPFAVDLAFRHSASSSKDPVWTAWHEACGHKWPGKEDRPTLQIGIIVQWSLKGRLGTFEERTILNDFRCPVELPANAA